MPGAELALLGPDPQVPRPPLDLARLEAISRDLLLAIGENPERPGLEGTPRRFAKWWSEFIAYDPGNTGTCFEAVGCDEMVVVSGMRVWSLCEHHLLPFWADVSCGYIAADRVLGLSKFARIAHRHAHKLQIQERLVQEIADDIQAVTGSPNVAVLARGQHLCMSMRGIRTDAMMTSSVMRGAFRDDHQVRQEFLLLSR